MSAQPVLLSEERARRRGSRERDPRARIPEEVICRLGEISPAAGRLYLWFCARRNHETGGWRCPIREAAAALKMDVATAYDARRELLGYETRGRRRGERRKPIWIELGAQDFMRPLVGYSANEEYQSAFADKLSANADSAIDKDRARAILPARPIRPTTHTHTGAGDPRCAHPAIQAVESIFNRSADKSWYDELIAILGDEPDAEKLFACRKEWIGRGYNPNALAWVRWYRDGIPERSNGYARNGRSQSGRERDHAEAGGGHASRLERERAEYERQYHEVRFTSTPSALDG